MVGRPEEERARGRCVNKWEDNIKMDIQEVGWGRMYKIDLAQDRDRCRDCCECGNEHSATIKCGKYVDYVRTS
jgi:hypothetical protein